MIMDGCQGKPRTPTILDKSCPQCGHEIEMFSTDTEMRCEHCGFTVYNALAVIGAGLTLGITLGDIAQEDHSGDTRKLDTLHGFPVSKKFEDLQFGRNYDPKKR